MLNEERVILMTQMASYENGEGRENVRIGNYFRSDYVTLEVLKGIVCSSLAFVIGFGVYLLCNFETIMQELYSMDLFAFAKNILRDYCYAVGAYSVLTYFISSWRYARAKKSLKCYYHNLKKLSSLYNEVQ